MQGYLSFVACLIFTLNIALSQSKLDPPRRQGYLTGADGIQLFYQVVGSGSDTTVFIHGIPSTMYTLASDFDELAENHTLIFYDQRGGGRSQSTKDTTLQRWTYHIRDLEELRKHFHFERMNLFGLSWGSWLATLYASEYPSRVRRMILLPPRVRSNPDLTKGPRTISRLDSLDRARMAHLRTIWQSTDNIQSVCEEYWRIAMRDMFFDTTAITKLKGSFCNEPPEVLRNTWLNAEAKYRSLGDFDFRPMLSRINVQTLLMKGTGIGMAKEWILEWAMSLPNSRVMFIPNCGLLPWIERPGVFFPAVDQFLRGSWPTGAESVFKE